MTNFSVRIFDFSLSINGFDIKKAKTVLSKIMSKSDPEYDAYIEEKKWDIVKFHLKHNSFYKNFGKSIILNDWSSVPVMNKRHLQQPINERLSEGYSIKNIYVNKTSGSSGDPFIFAKDKWCHTMTWAEIMNRFSWYGIDFNTSKQARFYGIPLDKKGYYKERIKDLFSNRSRFSIFDLSDKAFDRCVKKFKTTSFDFINGYTSPITQFAKYLKRKQIILKEVCPSLKVCIVTSEMLFEDDKKTMETFFGVPVVNEYGASELDLIAFENLNGELQLNTETLHIEILDDNDTILPPGSPGRIVITSLYNEAHPFIRYDIGDTGIISKNSSIKAPVLEKLIGRTNDIAILPSGKTAAGLTFYYITKSIIEDDGNVKEFTIEQVALDLFKINYASTSEISQSKKDIITQEMETYLEPGISVVFERHEKLTRTKAGKLKQFISKL